MTSTDAVVFVYGTLRPGQPNHVVAARGVAASVNAHGHGLRLYAAAHHGYPYATAGDPDDAVVGRPEMSKAPRVLVGLDGSAQSQRALMTALF